MTRVVVLGAGGPAGINFIRSLRETIHGYHVTALDDSEYGVMRAAQYADLALPMRDRGELAEQVMELEADVIYAAPDNLALWLADAQLPGAFLPSRRTIALCQDKFDAGLEWRRVGLREDRIIAVEGCLVEAGAELGYPLWLRARYGAGCRAATPVSSFFAGAAWLRYWHYQHSVRDFIAEAYLPGRDLAWTSVWHRGTLIASYARERVETLFGRHNPAGRSSTPAVARVIHEEAVNAVAFEAVLAVDYEPHGVFSVDLREDAEGVPRPTEINAGRFHTTSLMGARGGIGSNLADLYCCLALGARSPGELIEDQFDAMEEGALWLRGVDSEPVLVRERVYA